MIQTNQHVASMRTQASFGKTRGAGGDHDQKRVGRADFDLRLPQASLRHDVFVPMPALTISRRFPANLNDWALKLQLRDGIAHRSRCGSLRDDATYVEEFDSRCNLPSAPLRVQWKPDQTRLSKGKQHLDMLATISQQHCNVIVLIEPDSSQRIG